MRFSIFYRKGTIQIINVNVIVIVKNPSPVESQFYLFLRDKQLKVETNRPGWHTFSVQLYTGNGFSSSVFCK